MAIDDILANESRINVRVPKRLAGELRRIAMRDANGISATIRRLLAHAVAQEQSRPMRTEQ